MMSSDRDARIWRQIRRVEREIRTYESAKSTVEAVTRKSKSDKETWQQTYNRLGNNAELAKVEKKDVFEGEMAKRLGELVSEGMDTLTSDLSKTDSLNATLDNQVTKIESKIQQLEAERQHLYNML